MSQPVSRRIATEPEPPPPPAPVDEEEGEWKKLDISGMQLVALSPNISIYSNITELYLQNNSLTRLPTELFRCLTKLKHLDLSNNKIHFLQPEISHLLQLRELNLAWNQLRELPYELGKLFRLEKLAVEGNHHLIKPDPSVIQQGTQFCIGFCRDRMQSGEPPPPREWASNSKSSSNIHAEGFRVFCYNVLAESYAQPEHINYCPSWALNWEYRKHRILKEILSYEPDIICLQEVEAEQMEVFFQPEMASRGYVGKYHPKSRARTMDEKSKKTVDGCVIFWKRELFMWVADEVIEYQVIALLRHEAIGQAGINRMIPKDHIALTVLLKPIKGSALTISQGAGDNDCLLVVNTHIHWDPNYSDIKLMQVQMLVEKLEELAKRHQRTRGRPLPMVVCGDFNSGAQSAVYRLLSGCHVEGSHEEFCGQDYGVYTKEGLRHQLGLKSAYAEVIGGEPPFTNYSGDFVGVLDYIWYTEETLSAERVLVPLSEDIIVSHNGALPNPYMCSDHIPIACDLYGKIPR